MSSRVISRGDLFELKLTMRTYSVRRPAANNTLRSRCVRRRYAAARDHRHGTPLQFHGNDKSSELCIRNGRGWRLRYARRVTLETKRTLFSEYEIRAMQLRNLCIREWPRRTLKRKCANAHLPPSPLPRLFSILKCSSPVSRFPSSHGVTRTISRSIIERSSK